MPHDRAWAIWTAGTVLSFAALETHALRSQRAASLPGVSDKAVFPTLSACIWKVAGIHPVRPRRHAMRGVLAMLIGWFMAHILFMVPGPFEKEVIDHVRQSIQVRRSKRT